MYRKRAWKKQILAAMAVFMCWTSGVSAEELETKESIEVCTEELPDSVNDPLYDRAMGLLPQEFIKKSVPGEGYVHNGRFENHYIANGVDVSKYQQDIDWTAARNDGVEFALIRVGYRGSENGGLYEDPYYEQNLENAAAAGVKTGVYIFSQAITSAEAVAEAEFLLERIKPYNITMPVVIDYEYVANGKGRLAKAGLSNSEHTAVVNAFCKRVQEAGYTPMVYANKSMLSSDMNAEDIPYLVWLANYTSQTSYSGEYTFWQYTSKGSVNGIPGDVDCNFWYRPWAQVENGLGQAGNGDWYYAENGAVNNVYTGLVNHENNWYLVINGMVDFDYTGLYTDRSQEMWFVKNGMVDFTYNGIYEDENGDKAAISNGKLDKNYSGLIYDKEKGWLFFKEGMVDTEYEGLYYDAKYGWKLIKEGTVATAYNGLYHDKNCGWWLIKEGSVDFDYSGLYNDAVCGWWLINGGTVDFGYTGLYNDAVCGWWLVCNGTVVFDYNGLYNDAVCGWWLISSGAVDFGYTGLYNDAVCGWWLIGNGAVVFGYNGLYCDEVYGWWLINGGAVEFGYTGLYCDEVCGWWYIENGTVAFWYSGTVNYGDVPYQVVNGQLV